MRPRAMSHPSCASAPARALLSEPNSPYQPVTFTLNASQGVDALSSRSNRHWPSFDSAAQISRLLVSAPERWMRRLRSVIRTAITGFPPGLGAYITKPDNDGLWTYCAPRV